MMHSLDTAERQGGRRAPSALAKQITKRSNSNTAPRFQSIRSVDVKFGENVTVIEPLNLYGLTNAYDTSIGQSVELQKEPTIGKRCQIQSHSFICNLFTIADDSFVSHGAMFINDLFGTGGPAGKPELWRPTTLGNRVSI